MLSHTTIVAATHSREPLSLDRNVLLFSLAAAGAFARVARPIGDRRRRPSACTCVVCVVVVLRPRLARRNTLFALQFVSQRDSTTLWCFVCNFYAMRARAKWKRLTNTKLPHVAPSNLQRTQAHFSIPQNGS